MARGQYGSNPFSSFLQALFTGNTGAYGGNTRDAVQGEYRVVGAGQNALPLSEQLKEKKEKEDKEKKAAKKKKKIGEDMKQTTKTTPTTSPTINMTGVASVGTGLGIPTNPNLQTAKNGRKTPATGLGTNGGLY